MTLRLLVLSAVLLAASPAQTIIEGSGVDGLGTALIVADFDGDGAADILAGAPTFTSNGFHHRGRVLIVAGGKGDIASRSRAWIAAGAGSSCGTCLAAGDVDGDGKIDLIVGAPGAYRGRGAVHVISGAQVLAGGVLATGSGLTFHADLDISRSGRGGTTGSPVESEHRSSSPLTGFGQVVAAGDLDGDGIDDLVISEPVARVGQLPDCGRVLVFRGRKRWPGNTIAIRDGSCEPDLVLGGREREGLGSQLLVADVSGDGIDDLVALSPYARNRGDPRSGSAVVILGRKGLLAKKRALAVGTDAVDLLIMGRDGGGLGAAAAALDLDGDGRQELLLGEPRRSAPGAKAAGAILAIPVDGSEKVLDFARRDAPVALCGQAMGEELGGALCVAPISGGPALDLLVGSAPAGRVILLEDPGGGKLPSRPAKAFMPSGHATGAFGASLGAGDLDGDGKSEIVIGAPQISKLFIYEL